MYEISEMIYEKKGDLHRCFKGMDNNNDGTLSTEEYVKGISAGLIPATLSLPQTDVLMKILDQDHNGHVDYCEFIRRFEPYFAQMLRRRYGVQDETGIVSRVCEAIFKKRGTLKNAFLLMDHDSSGTVTVDEFKEALVMMEVISDIEEVSKIVATVDVNGDGIVSYDEFFGAFSIHFDHKNNKAEHEVTQRKFSSRELIGAPRANIGGDQHVSLD